MNFFKQVLAEARNMLRSKFILISMIVFFALITIGAPLFAKFIENSYTYYPYDQEYVVVDGVEYKNDNDFTREYTYLENDYEWYTESASSPEVAKHLSELYDMMIAFYGENIKYAAETGADREWDYRENLLYQVRRRIIDNYVLENYTEDETEHQQLNEAVGYFGYSEYIDLMYKSGEMTMPMPDTNTGEEQVKLTAEERAEIIAENKEYIAKFTELMKTDDLAIYAGIQKAQYEKDLEENEKRIEKLEKDVLEDPSQEKYVSEEIARIKLGSKMIVEINLPQLEYRLANNIIPRSGTWQDEVLDEIENKTWRINDYENNLASEEDFNQQNWLVQEYTTYENYLKAQEEELQKNHEDLFVAENSLNSGKPDMKFVRDGARTKLYSNFGGVMVVVLFGVLVGGWALASEFQNGTVRLMMIRPRTRTKIFASKYLAGLILVFALYFAIFAVGFVVSGVQGGFGDYGYPNYTASGPASFFMTFIGDFFAVFVSAMFLYTVAFMFSAVVRNTAVSIIIPIVMYVGALIGMNMLGQYPAVDALAYTPVPYLLLQDYINIQNYGYVSNFIQKGMPISLEMGVAMLVVYGALIFAFGMFMFKKRDITN